MKAVSIDWAKLKPEQKDDYFQKARVNRAKFYEMKRQWEYKHGPKRDGEKQIRELEERRKQSIVTFLTHGLEFGKAAVFNKEQ